MDGLSRVVRLVCGRRTKWAVLVAWLVVGFALAPMAGLLGGVQKNDQAEWLPGNAESTEVVALQKRFRTVDTVPAIVVYERLSGITPGDEAKATADATALAAVPGVVGQVVGPLPAQDGRALQVVVPIEQGTDGFEKVAAAVDGVRAVTGTGAGGLGVYVTGPAGISADTAKAFEGIDARLLFVTAIVVVVLLLLTYRSPVLWLFPLISAGLALTVSQAVIYLAVKLAGVTVNGQSAGILTVLVFGAATDYALLLIARYREELVNHADRHEAMAVALRRAAPAIVASAATVATALFCLTFADMNSTRGLGPVCAIGITVGLLVMVTLLPALLVIVGRWVFWPVKPRYGVVRPNADRGWRRLGVVLARSPRRIWLATALVLAIMTLGALQLRADGLPSDEWFVTEPRSVAGQAVLARHFPAGEGQPVVVIGNAAAADQLRTALAGASGIADVTEPILRDGRVLIEGTLLSQPDGTAARTSIERLRDAVHAVPGADAKVGGLPALSLDTHRANRHDNALTIPLVLVAVLLILAVLLRAVVAPLVLVATVIVSFGAALGVSTLLFENVLGFHGADSAHPLWVFVFLVALGIDYNIFLATRIRERVARYGTRRAVQDGLTATGGVITSAGLVLAATFGVFGSMPLVTFAQMGLAVALGVLLDTFIVRSVLVPALMLDLGDRIWWPSRLTRATTPDQAGTDPTPADPFTADALTTDAAAGPATGTAPEAAKEPALASTPVVP